MGKATHHTSLHPAVRDIVTQFEAAELHAARAGREVMRVLTEVAVDNHSSTLEELAGEIEAAVAALLRAMPAYAPPLNVIHRIMSRVEEALERQASAGDLRAGVANDAEDYRRWSQGAREKIAHHGAALIPDGATVFTFTLSETTLHTLVTARDVGKMFSVLVTESRPNNDGLVTVTKLAERGIPASVSVDACMGELVPQADIMMVGAEAIMADGSAICKVGTYPAALVARAHGVPVYVIVDTMKFNVTSLFGLPLRLDTINANDVLDSDESRHVTVVGHLFDRTPMELISGIVTERGILNPAACLAVFEGMSLSESLAARLTAWAYGHKHLEP
jgi:translation initiation factor 2B subunit (eIF-2B alpha/beta/delta family)